MRWFWIDRFTEFVSGKYARAMKAVSLSEEVVDEYAPGLTYFPASLLIEGLAQCGGLLVAQVSDFHNRTVLAKIGNAKFHRQVHCGHVLEYETVVTGFQPQGAFVDGKIRLGDELVVEVDLMFAFLNDERFESVTLFEPVDLCRMCRLMRLFEVGLHEDGRPISVPEHFIAAEKAALINSH
ncbi:MAG: beta-hydroxyacyl-ACP dehydratase [Pirellulaceae bacterium]|jgi:3-hydroxyacyl-[acyl-carrier-protein] dehydratase|nr:beta-hydroxyacyl-ACP dehydratase [Pirellulaceae bacterium]